METMSENENHVWQDAHVGSGHSGLTVRMTDEEKERLEQLRQELRLTSKGQVMRVALDALERFMVVGAALGMGSLRGENWREVAALTQKGVQGWEIQNLEKNALAAGEAGAGGLPADTAPLGPGVPGDEKQLELPEMPPQGATNAA
jgi:hypothetical protein